MQKHKLVFVFSRAVEEALGRGVCGWLIQSLIEDAGRSVVVFRCPRNDSLGYQSAKGVLHRSSIWSCVSGRRELPLIVRSPSIVDWLLLLFVLAALGRAREVCVVRLLVVTI